MNKVIFTGDTIFIGGCGKFFEGTGEDMQKNVDTVKGLPEDTYMFPGHDYTEANLKWAEGIEWENGAYMNLLLKLAERIEKDPKVLGKYFMPTSLKEEKESNIFFRTDNAVQQKKLGVTTEVQCMAKLRNLKDSRVSLKTSANL